MGKAKTVQVVSSDNLDRTLVVEIDGVRYEYWFHGEVPLTTVHKILRYSPGRCIQYLRKNSYKAVKLVDGVQKV